MVRRTILQVDGAEAFAAAFAVSRETAAKLQIYADLLGHWQKAVNLVAPATLEDLWQRHFADSAQLLKLAPDARAWLDLGSGAGFPGMAIAIMLANHMRVGVHLVESNARKCAFLAEVAHKTGATVNIHNCRIETPELAARVGRVDIVTARALAPLPRLLGQALPFFSPRTRGLFPKGRTAERELAAARGGFDFASSLHPSRTDPEGRIVEVARPRARSRP